MNINYKTQAMIRYLFNKILRKSQDQEGYFDYFSLSTDLFGVNFLYEFKDYNMLYYMPILSNPPLGYMETSSVLMSTPLIPVKSSVILSPV